MTLDDAVDQATNYGTSQSIDRITYHGIIGDAITWALSADSDQIIWDGTFCAIDQFENEFIVDSLYKMVHL